MGESKKGELQQPKEKKSVIWEYVEAIIIAVILAFMFKPFDFFFNNAKA